MASPPPGFELIPRGDDFERDFGPIFWDRRERLAFRIEQRHANADGVMHGGAMATFADQQLLALLPAQDGPRLVNPTIHLSVDFLAPAPVGAWMEAAVTLVRATRTMLFSQAVMSVDGDPVARSAAIYRRNRHLEAFP